MGKFKVDEMKRHTLPTAQPTWKIKSHRKMKTKKASQRNDCHLNNTCVSNAFITVCVCDVYEKWDRINCMEIPWKNLRKSYWELRKCMTTHTQIRLKWYEFLLIGVALESKGGWAIRVIVECKMCVCIQCTCTQFPCVQNYSMLIVGKSANYLTTVQASHNF